MTPDSHLEVQAFVAERYECERTFGETMNALGIAPSRVRFEYYDYPRGAEPDSFMRRVRVLEITVPPVFYTVLRYKRFHWRILYPWITVTLILDTLP